jgi:hypothetical protein
MMMAQQALHRASPSGVQEPQHGLLDMPGALLCMIWQQLQESDRKSLCCAARAVRACEGGVVPFALIRPGLATHKLPACCRDQRADEMHRGAAA